MESSSRRDFLFLMLKFLEEEDLNESQHKLEQESGIFFNLERFKKMIIAGKWDDVEKYLNGFTESIELFYTISKHKFLEALYRLDKTEAFDILMKDLKVFSACDPELLKEITMLLTLEDCREHTLLSGYNDNESARKNLLGALEALIKENPLICDKLLFPTARTSRLQTMFNSCYEQLNNAERNLQSETSLFTDQLCHSRDHTSSSISRPVVPTLSPHTPFLQRWNASNPSLRWPPSESYGLYADPSLSGTANTTVLTPSTVSILPGQDTFAKRPRTLSNYATSSIEQRPKHLEPISNCKVLPLKRKDDPASKVARILYTNAGDIVVLSTNGDQELWKWMRRSKQKADATVDLQLWHPKNGLQMANDVSGTPEAVPCLALCNSNIMSAVGGKISLFSLKNLQLMKTFLPPPPAPTFLAGDNSIVAIGLQDSTIQIYNLKVQKVKDTLRGHQKHITGLAFSNKLKILVSSCADGQLCVWDTNTWEMKQSLTLQNQSTSNRDTQVQFNINQIHFLVCQERRLAIYEASHNVECIHQWEPKDDLQAPITAAAYSCKSLLVYVAFNDGSIGVFDAETLRVARHILPSAYIPTSQPLAYPIVLATHPDIPSQLVVGLSDGSVKVLEPSGSDGWLGISSAATGAASSSANWQLAAGAGAASSSGTGN